MRKLLFTLILLLAGVIGYMYYFGKGEDKSNAEVIVRETKDVVHSVGDFLKRQKEKYDDGEFDKLIDKVGKSIGKLKSAKPEKSDQVQQTLQELQDEIRKIDTSRLSAEQKKQVEDLLRDVQEQINRK